MVSAQPKAADPGHATGLRGGDGKASVAALQSSKPVFRPIDEGQRTGAGRLTDRSVSRIKARRVRVVALAAGKERPGPAHVLVLWPLDAGRLCDRGSGGRRARLPHPAAHSAQVGGDGRSLRARGRQVDEIWAQGRWLLRVDDGQAKQLRCGREEQ